jgi:hypothetical protein
MLEYTVKGKMFETFEEFSYLQCENCKALTLKNIIYDYSSYYPKDYYSLISPNSFSVNPAKSIFSRRQIECYKILARDFNKRGIAGRACFFIEELS